MTAREDLTPNMFSWTKGNDKKTSFSSLVVILVYSSTLKDTFQYTSCEVAIKRKGVSRMRQKVRRVNQRMWERKGNMFHVEKKRTGIVIHFEMKTLLLLLKQLWFVPLFFCCTNHLIKISHNDISLSWGFSAKEWLFVTQEREKWNPFLQVMKRVDEGTFVPRMFFTEKSRTRTTVLLSLQRPRLRPENGIKKYWHPRRSRDIIILETL